MNSEMTMPLSSAPISIATKTSVTKTVRTVGAIGLALACSVGCSSSDPPAVSGNGGTGTGGGSTNPGGGTSANGGSAATVTPPVGLFTITLVPLDAATSNPAHTNLVGMVRDAPQNEALGWKLTGDEGGCQLYQPDQPFCETACPSGQTCVPGNVCKVNPTGHSVGAVTVTGLETASGPAEFTINPVAPSYNYMQPSSVTLAYPPAGEGAEITVAAAGGDYQAFQLKASGIAPIELSGPDPIPMQNGQAMSLSWVPKGAAGKSRMQILVNISVHGGGKGKITCDVEDNGALQIPASLVTGLIGYGVAGYPTVAFTRRSAGSADISVGRVDLQVVTTVERALLIPGLISCGTNEECPTGQVCTNTRVCGTG